MTDCVFCKIIAKDEIPSTEIYKDDTVYAFLDINPVNHGHVLVVPKIHYPKFEETPDAVVSHIFVKSKKLMCAIKQGMRADYVAVAIVGTDVPHFHIHLVPRYHNDGLAGFWPTKKYDKKEMESAAEKIRGAL
ncbi:MAG: Hit-like protein involved in cell-cycle regulation [Parcubacteria group bacterium Gr01-1014_17]|nr:MAG: Hit-like protein involved in cell-cycle regulation [Parcubacteria group bacterium Gr01-1014_17]